MDGEKKSVLVFHFMGAIIAIVAFVFILNIWKVLKKDAPLLRSES